MSTRVIYNSVDFGIVKTQKLESKAKKDPSGTDVIDFEHTITIDSVVSIVPDPENPGNLMNVPDVAGLAPQATPADLARIIRHKLLVPRRPFRMTSGTGVLFDIADPPDSANGPMPVSCRVTGMTESTIRIEWTCVVSTPECGYQAASQQFASNRWTQTQDIDGSGYSTISTDGVLFVRSDMRQNPDLLRASTLPAMLPGFHRVNSKYVLQADGLALRYSFKDTELYVMPPPVATKAEGTFSVTTASGGAMYLADVSVTLEGKKDTPKRDLVAMAVLIALRRLEKTGTIAFDKADKATNPILQGGISEQMYENKVSVNLRAQLHPRQSKIGNPSPNVIVGGGGIGARAGSWFYRKFVEGQQEKEEREQREAMERIKKAAEDVKNKDSLTAFNTTFPDAFGYYPFDSIPYGAGIQPNPRGNIGFWAMVAAQFRDPCLGSEVGRVISPSDNVPEEVRQTVQNLLPSVSSLGNPANSTSRPEGTLWTAIVPDASIQEYTNLNDDALPGVYTEYYAEIEYQIKSNVAYMPYAPTKKSLLEIAEGGIKPKTTAIKYAEDTSWVIVRCKATKSGFPPEIPTVSGDPNLTFAELKVIMPAMIVGLDAETPIYSTEVELRYTVIDADLLTFRPPVAPWVKIPAATVPGGFIPDVNTQTSEPQENRLSTPGFRA
jgi:hypothetical protein